MALFEYIIILIMSTQTRHDLEIQQSETELENLWGKSPSSTIRDQKRVSELAKKRILRKKSMRLADKASCFVFPVGYIVAIIVYYCTVKL